MICIYVATNQIEADLIRLELEAAGIPATIKAGPTPMGSGPYPEVWVPAAMEPQAMEIVAELEAGDADSTGTSEELTP
ncbi:MAG: DUF2007 domain-containing protein [Gemmatimonadetes bacterium]|nr:DUF2007 domain-containing protein [Gemmatimonadota bacterium]